MAVIIDLKDLAIGPSIIGPLSGNKYKRIIPPIKLIEIDNSILIDFYSKSSSLVISIETSEVMDVLWTWANDTTDSGNTPPTKNMSSTDGSHVLYLEHKANITSLICNISDFTISLSDLNVLNNLSYLSLYNTSVSGDISNLANMVSLTHLYLYDTAISGDISNLSNMINLTYLSLRNTSISGDISNLSNMVNLTDLRVSSTSISGNVSDLINLVNLTYLSIHTISISGDISNLSNMTNLAILFLHNTSVSGDIGNLANMTKLKTLYLYNTDISQVDLSSMVSQLWSNRTVFGTNSLNLQIQNNEGLTADAIDMINGIGSYSGDGLIQAGCTVTY